MCAFQSMMVLGSASSCRADARDTIQGDEEVLPDAPLAGEDGPSVARDAIVAPPPLSRFLDPAPFDQPLVLEPVERGIERRYVKTDRAAGALADQATDLVAVA